MAAVILAVDKGLPSVYAAFVKGRFRTVNVPASLLKQISSRINGLPEQSVDHATSHMFKQRYKEQKISGRKKAGNAERRSPPTLGGGNRPRMHR